MNVSLHTRLQNPLIQPVVLHVGNKLCRRITSYYPSYTTKLGSDEPDLLCSPEKQCSHLGHGGRTSHSVRVVTEFSVTWQKETRPPKTGEDKRDGEGEQLSGYLC